MASQVNDPSAGTRAIVVRALQQREAARAGTERGVAGAATGMAPNNINHAFEEWLASYRGRLARLLNSEQENSK